MLVMVMSMMQETFQTDDKHGQNFVVDLRLSEIRLDSGKEPLIL